MPRHNAVRFRGEPPDLTSTRDRIVQVLRSKRNDAHRYWIEKGRGRFAAELLADAVPPEAAEVFLDRIETDLFRVDVDLDAMLRDLAARHTAEVQSDPRQGAKREDRDGDKREEHRGPRNADGEDVPLRES